MADAIVNRRETKSMDFRNPKNGAKSAIKIGKPGK